MATTLPSDTAQLALTSHNRKEMHHPIHKVSRFVLVSIAMTTPLLTACTDGDSDNNGPYQIEGAIWGLRSEGLVIQNTSGSRVPVGSNWFTIPESADNGSRYNVTVVEQPDGQICEVEDGTGVISGSDITSIAIHCRGWRGAVPVTDLNDAANLTRDNAVMALDANGNAVVAWEQNDNGTRSIRSNRYISGSGWHIEETIYDQLSGSVNGLRIASNESGNSAATWTVSEGPSSDTIYVNYMNAGGPWSGPEAVEAISGLSFNPEIAIDPEGNALVVWRQSASGVRLYANHYIVGSGWGTPQAISDEGGVYTPQIDFDNSGNAMAIWAQTGNSTGYIWSNRYAPDTGWGTPEPVAINDSGSNPQLAMDASGNAMAVWTQSDGERHNVWANRYVEGQGWGVPELIETDNQGDAANPRFRMRVEISGNDNGDIVAVWPQSDGSLYHLWANQFRVNEGWDTPTLIENNNSTNVSIAKVATDVKGNALVVWVQYESSGSLIYTNRYSKNSGWNGPEQRPKKSDVVTNPNVKIDSYGNGLLVWENHSGNYYRLSSNRFD